MSRDFSIFQGWDFSMWNVRKWGKYGLHNLTERIYFFNKIPQLHPSTVYIIFPHTHSPTQTLVKWGKIVSLPHAQLLPKVHITHTQ